MCDLLETGSTGTAFLYQLTWTWTWTWGSKQFRPPPLNFRHGNKTGESLCHCCHCHQCWNFQISISWKIVWHNVKKKKHFASLHLYKRVCLSVGQSAGVSNFFLKSPLLKISFNGFLGSSWRPIPAYLELLHSPSLDIMVISVHTKSYQ